MTLVISTMQLTVPAQLRGMIPVAESEGISSTPVDLDSKTLGKKDYSVLTFVFVTLFFFSILP